MSTHRQWDESRSPQWKYLLQKESAQRRKTRKDIEVERARKQMEEGAPPKKRINKKGKTPIKRYVRPKGNQKMNRQDTITDQLKQATTQLVYTHEHDPQTTTRLSTEPKEQE